MITVSNYAKNTAAKLWLTHRCTIRRDTGYGASQGVQVVGSNIAYRFAVARAPQLLAVPGEYRAYVVYELKFNDSQDVQPKDEITDDQLGYKFIVFDESKASLRLLRTVLALRIL